MDAGNPCRGSSVDGPAVARRGAGYPVLAEPAIQARRPATITTGCYGHQLCGPNGFRTSRPRTGLFRAARLAALRQNTRIRPAKQLLAATQYFTMTTSWDGPDPRPGLVLESSLDVSYAITRALRK